MDTDSYTDLTLRRERVNKHSVRYTARDCTESAATPCPSVTLPTALVAELGLAEGDDLRVRVAHSGQVLEHPRGQRASEALREKLRSIPDLSAASPIYEQLLLETDSLLAESIAASALVEEQRRQREPAPEAPTEALALAVEPPPADLDLVTLTPQALAEAITNEVTRLIKADGSERHAPVDAACSCGVNGSKTEPTCEGHPRTGSGD